MKNLYCDICKKSIDDPVPSWNFFQIREFDVCDACKDVIDARLKPVVKGHFPYSADWYEQQLLSLIEKGIHTNRP